MKNVIVFKCLVPLLSEKKSYTNWVKEHLQNGGQSFNNVWDWFKKLSGKVQDSTEGLSFRLIIRYSCFPNELI